MADNPRLLKEIQEYRDLLNAKDDALKVISVLTGDAAVEVTATCTVSVKSGSSNVASQIFNKHLNIWLVDNIKKIAPEIAEMIDAELERNRQEAEDEASLLGLTASPTLPPAPVITSASTANAIKGQIFEYIIEAQNATVGSGITFCEYFVTGTPDWLSFDRTRHRLIGTVPSIAITNNKVNLELMVTTNVGIATKTLTLTYKDTAEEEDLSGVPDESTPTTSGPSLDMLG